jgi:hypothetical protein
MRTKTLAALLATTLLSFAAPVGAATWGELTSGTNGAAQGPYPVGPYAVAPQPGTCWQCQSPSISGGPQGTPPAQLDAPALSQLPPQALMPPDAFLPFGREGRLPSPQTQIWSFGQVNNTTDPFNQAGLSTPFMFVPWSTPLSGWTNAQTWNWWRERSGTRSPLW